jgi:hypothetical protein
MIRDLIYHICPLLDNDIWIRNVEQLLARFHVFNGRKVIAIATGERMHSPDMVMGLFRGHDMVRFMKVPNDRNLREVASFPLLLDAVETENENVACFYAHTKGNSTVDSVEGATYWRNVMYLKLLDEWQDRMKDLEAGAAAVGTHLIGWPKGTRSPYPSRLMHGQWMFAGTFFWFRSARIFTHPDWRQVPRDRYGAEAWLAGLFERDQVKCCFQPWPPGTMHPDPYDPQLYSRLGLCIADCEIKTPSWVI